MKKLNIKIIVALVILAFSSIVAMADTISSATDAGTLLGTEKYPVAKLGVTAPRSTTTAKISDYVLSVWNNTFHTFNTASTDCSADVSTALQAHLANNNGIARLPAGCYRLDTGITLPAGVTNFDIQPLGNGEVTIYHKDATTPAFSADYSGTASSARTISGITQVLTNVSTVGDYVDRIQLASAKPSLAVRGNYCFVYSDDSGIGQGTAPIIAISKANPAVITLPGTVSTSDFANGQTIRVEFAKGMTQINNPSATYTLANRATTATTTTFELSGLDSTGFSTYTGGGYIAGVTTGFKHGFQGEGFTVLNTDADATTDTIDVYGRLKNSSFYLTNPALRCLDPTLKVNISGLKITTLGDASGAGTVRAPAIKLTGVVNPKVSNNIFEYPWAQSVWIQASAGGEFNNLESRYGVNNPSKNQYTYGLNFYGMNYAHVVRGLRQEQGRHAITTDSSSNANLTTSWINRGGPNDITVYDTACKTSDGTCIDEHYEGFNITFKGVECTRPQRGSSAVSGTIQGACIQSRSLNPVYENVTVNGGSRGISISQTDHGFPNNITLNGFNVRDLSSPYSATNKGQWTDYAVEFDDQTTSNATTKLFVKNAILNNVGVGFYANKKADISVDGLYAWNVDEIGRLEGGAKIDLSGQQTWDYRAQAFDGTTQLFLNRFGTSSSDVNLGFYMRGDANYGGSTARVFTKPTIYMAANNFGLVDIFEEHSTTGTPKNYYWAGSTLINPSSVTAPFVIEPGATTIALDTTVSDSVAGINSTGNITASSGTISGPTITGTTTTRGGQFCDENGANCFEASAVAGLTAAANVKITFNGRADSSTTLTAMALADQFFPQNSKRAVLKEDLTGMLQCRLVANIAAASASPNSPKITAMYKTTFNYAADAITTFSDLGTSEIGVSLSTSGVVASSWVDVAAGAKSDVFISLKQVGGDATAAPGLGLVELQCK